MRQSRVAKASGSGVSYCSRGQPVGVLSSRKFLRVFVIVEPASPHFPLLSRIRMADAASIEAAFAEQLTQHTHEDGSAIAVPGSPAIHRFVRARKGDVSAAALQYANTARWRLAERVDSITEPDPEEPIYQAVCPHRNHGLAPTRATILLAHLHRQQHM